MTGRNCVGGFGARDVNGGESSSLPRRRRRIQRRRTIASASISRMMKPPRAPAMIVFVLLSAAVDFSAEFCAAKEAVGTTVTGSVDVNIVDRVLVVTLEIVIHEVTEMVLF